MSLISLRVSILIHFSDINCMLSVHVYLKCALLFEETNLYNVVETERHYILFSFEEVEKD